MPEIRDNDESDEDIRVRDHGSPNEELERIIDESESETLTIEDVESILYECENEAISDLTNWISDDTRPSMKQTLEIVMSWPEIHGTTIESYAQLHELVLREYPSLMEREDFTKVMKDAKNHFDLLRRYDGRTVLNRGEIRQISRELEVSEGTVRKWIRKGLTPKIYAYIEWSVPRSEAEIKVEALELMNNGIQTIQDVYARLGLYYFGENERTSHFFEKEIQLAENYLRFLQMYRRGGMNLTITKAIGIPESTGFDWLGGNRPRLIKIAAAIPDSEPSSAHKWLPLQSTRAGQCNVLDNFIEVPVEITCITQIQRVLRNIEPLVNDEMIFWKNKYGDISQIEAFVYLLGVIVSDSNVPTTSTSKIAYGLSQTKRKDWTQDFGDCTCYYLGKIGIYAHQVKDTASGYKKIVSKSGTWEFFDPGKYVWYGENCTLLKWIRTACLGYDDSPKTYQELSADWILDTNLKMRTAFLQGYSDGDGGVGITWNAERFSIATISNHTLIGKLMESFDVEPYISKKYVSTRRLVDFLKISQIPPFRHATGRLDDLSKSLGQVIGRKPNKYRKYISSK